ncbi:TadE family protein [Streptacidiphilus jiangxiensis]|uniref:TadE-like protein n=1 Tax=Streptacidiphilus jiangxiensis TaxID=235985 RepID=A0A1H8BLY2_STRJI|nr:TadE family protein [Streptacidiphilus jiangxiensis]SEM83900.1 TadE-like protein [Streptacidiphilus jiangxiensis]
MTFRTLKLRARREDGSASIEAAIVVPVLILFLCLAWAAGRIALTGQVVDGAAEDAARAASISKTPGAAYAAAYQAAARDMASSSTALHCSPAVSIPDKSIPTRSGQSGYVTVKVSCTVSFADLFGLHLGSKTLTSTFTSYADTYTQR